MSRLSRSNASTSDLQILSTALATIPGSGAIRVRPGQAPTRADALQNLLFSLSLMTAAERKARDEHATSRPAGRRAHPRSSAA